MVLALHDGASWLPWRCQGFDDPALRHAAVATLVDESVQLPAQGLKVADLAVHLLAVFPGDRVHCLAGSVPVFGQAQ